MTAISDFGKVSTVISNLLKIIISVLFILGGGYLASKKQEFVFPVNATLAEPFNKTDVIKINVPGCDHSLPLYGINPDNPPDCFVGSKKTFTGKIVCPDGSDIPPFSVYVKHLGGCPVSAHFTSDKTIKIIGIGMVSLSSFIILTSLLGLYLVFKYESYASYQGILGIMFLLR